MKDKYPQAEYPWNFYFNGEELPRWSPYWHRVDVGSYIEKLITDWDVIFAYQQFRVLSVRLNCAVGRVRSEDPRIFILSALTVLDALQNNRKEIELNMKNCVGVSNGIEALADLDRGLPRLIELASRDDLCMWIVGYSDDKKFLLEQMQAYQANPESHELPHISSNRSEMGLEIRSLAQKTGLAGKVDLTRYTKRIRYGSSS